MSLNYGRVYLVGAGCGDFDLITLRGKSLLEQCSVVVYDNLIDNRLLGFIPKNAEKICVGKRSGFHSETQDNINNILVEKAKNGHTVVRLKGGDPFVFGRGGEEILALQENGIEYSVVPGITSAVAVPELAGIPVTHRRLSRSFHVITGHTADNILPEKLQTYALLDGTLVFLMGLKHLREIASGLIAGGKNPQTPTAVISNGASSGQRILRASLNNIAERAEEEHFTTPSIIVVGEVTEFDFLQTVSLPLYGISVSVTGTKRFSEKLSEQLGRLGADIQTVDYLNVVEYRENPKLEHALQNIQNYGWIVLTSINGAEIFLKRLASMRIDIRTLSQQKIAVIGSGTAEVLEKRGIFPQLIPEEYTSKSLGNALAKLAIRDEKILILRAEQGSKELSEILDENNLAYDDIKTYDVICDKESGFEIDTDFVTFASSSGVNAFFENGYRISPKTKIVCIGEITAKALEKHNIENYRISKTSNIQGIIDMILSEVHLCRDSED